MALKNEMEVGRSMNMFLNIVKVLCCSLVFSLSLYADETKHERDLNLSNQGISGVLRTIILPIAHSLEYASDKRVRVLTCVKIKMASPIHGFDGGRCSTYYDTNAPWESSLAYMLPWKKFPQSYLFASGGLLPVTAAEGSLNIGVAFVMEPHGSEPADDYISGIYLGGQAGFADLIGAELGYFVGSKNDNRAENDDTKIAFGYLKFGGYGSLQSSFTDPDEREPAVADPKTFKLRFEKI